MCRKHILACGSKHPPKLVPQWFISLSPKGSVIVGGGGGGGGLFMTFI